jgi:hypothetical protein
VDELAVQPPQEPENVADDHREQIINNLSDEDIPFPAAPQIPGQNKIFNFSHFQFDTKL